MRKKEGCSRLVRQLFPLCVHAWTIHDLRFTITIHDSPIPSLCPNSRQTVQLNSPPHWYTFYINCCLKSGGNGSLTSSSTIWEDREISGAFLAQVAHRRTPEHVPHPLPVN